MTEITVTPKPLPPAVERFVLHWGEMGTRWGVNRSVSQIHALLYVSERPLTAEDIAAALGLARSNVSTSLKELQGWGLVARVHVMGDRRDYFVAETDLWQMLVRIAAGRKEREIDPTLAVLRSCASDAAQDRSMSPVAKDRLAAMQELVETLDGWYAQLSRIPQGKLAKLMRAGGAVSRLVGPRKGPGGKDQGP
jgi:DNA-binding transcriptional regulator GbsR (MarR family)